MWTPKDADNYTQEADDPELKDEWAKVADKDFQATGDQDTAIRNANRSVAKKRAKKSAAEELLDLAKAFDSEGPSIGNNVQSNTKLTVRTHVRKFRNRQNANRVRPQKRTRMINPNKVVNPKT